MTRSKLQSVTSTVAKALDKLEGQTSGVSADALVSLFFGKVPSNFLKATSIEQLAHIVLDCYLLAKAVSDDLNSHAKGTPIGSLVRCKSLGTGPELFIAITLPDRPFIVNTISEILRQRGIEIEAFIHPIISIAGNKISTSFLSLSDVPTGDHQELFNRLESALSDLLIITEDHSAILLGISRLNERVLLHARDGRAQITELSEFLHWLSDGNFLFLGLQEKPRLGNFIATQGLFRSPQPRVFSLLDEVQKEVEAYSATDEQIRITRLLSCSPIHHLSPIISITLKTHATPESPELFTTIIGLLTSKARSQEASSIPLIREKLKRLLDLEDLVFNSHDYKFVTDILDTMPKDEALRMGINDLQSVVHSILEMRHSRDIHVSYYFNQASSAVTVLVIMPRERFNSQIRQKIQSTIEENFGAPSGSSEYHLNYSQKPMVRFYFHVPVHAPSGSIFEAHVLKERIAAIARTWNDDLESLLQNRANEHESRKLWQEYRTAFPLDYQALHSADDALFDIQCIEELRGHNHVLTAALAPHREAGAERVICLYSAAGEITISKALPILDNMGLEVLNEASSIISLSNKHIYCYRFTVSIRSGATFDDSYFAETTADALCELFLERAENDPLNKLLIESRIPLRGVALLRLYCALLWQITKYASRHTIYNSLAMAPQLSQQLWEMFLTRFDPSKTTSLDERQSNYKFLLDQFRDSLRSITDITQDRILRGVADLLSGSVRTNYFQGHERLAIKLQPRDIDIMPNPKPLFEIFVRTPLTEGTHLRNGPVSRGGIRWSDRHEDYRMEVLGLMATQTMKNVLIVPDGAKGGFIVRRSPRHQEDMATAVKEAYQEYIRSLLSLTDNRVLDTIIRPTHTVCWDSPDPYFVVAADKGTAAFSDTANEIAITEFSFWLGDAFASGGSLGYDHKKYAITAKGAWESTRRHFFDLGIDHTKTPFSAVGIGDMSGDVFGNGALLSRTMKLIAAFDHRHVFVDPNPDLDNSFLERQRLFNLKRSSWNDYDRSLISTGGGVFSRFDKEIEISPEIRRALNMPDTAPSTMSGEELISHVLKAPVDLLFNGGIGTYVKSSTQSHADVNDGTNDRVRIDANELRARIVVEGGNLGFTQRARVEFAELGGRINTDAIDNSGGVDLSDHEVNLKVLFSELINQGMCDQATRDRLMLEISGDIVDLVLRDNRYHALLLSIAVSRSRRNISYFHSFIHRMVKLGYVTRHRDSLPDDDALNERVAKKLGLVRPELSVLIAAAKRWMKLSMLETTIPDHPLLADELLRYFPKTLQSAYREQISKHPLGRNIIATQLTNYLVNTTGVTFLHRMCAQYSVSPEIVIRCSIAAQYIIGAQKVHDTLWVLDTPSDNDFFCSCWTYTSGAVREATSWLLKTHGATLSLQEMIELYHRRFQTLVDHADDIFEPKDNAPYASLRARAHEKNVEESSARRLALFPDTLRIFEMLWASRESAQSIPTVARVYELVIHALNLHGVFSLESKIEPLSKWESELLSHSFDDIRRGISTTVIELITHSISDSATVHAAITQSENYEQFNATLSEISDSAPPVTSIAVLARQIVGFRPKVS